MRNQINALQGVVITREIDLSELDEAYTGVTFPIRVNWTRGFKKRRRDLAESMEQLQQQLVQAGKMEAGPERDAAVARVSDGLEANNAGWERWLSDLFCCEWEEIQQLRDVLPEQHYPWITQSAIRLANEWEQDTVKKATARRLGISEEPAESRLQS